MLPLQKQVDYIFSSDPANGATNISQNGSSFEVNFGEPFEIPANATNVDIKVSNATIWWTVPNIHPGINDGFVANINGIAIATVIPVGLYDLNGLQAAIRTIMINNGVPPVYATTNFALTADANTQRVIVNLLQAGDSIQVGAPASCFLLCGFPTGSPPVVGPNAAVTAPDVAAFNEISYFLIHSDIVQRGIRFNANWNQTIAQVLIDVPPGSQITYAPYNPPTSQANELAGVKRWNARFWLTDSQDQPVDTFGEFWTARVTVTYIIPILIR